MIFSSKLWSIIGNLFGNIDPTKWRHAYNIVNILNATGMSRSIEVYISLAYRLVSQVSDMGVFMEGGAGSTDRIFLCDARVPEMPVFAVRYRTDYDTIARQVRSECGEFCIMPGSTETDSQCFLSVTHTPSQTHFALKWCDPANEVFENLWQNQ